MIFPNKYNPTDFFIVSADRAASIAYLLVQPAFFDPEKVYLWQYL